MAPLVLIEAARLDEPDDGLARRLVVVLLVALVERDQLLRAVDHALDVHVALRQERREPLHLAHPHLLLLVLLRGAAPARRGLAATTAGGSVPALLHLRVRLLQRRRCGRRRHVRRRAGRVGTQDEGEKDRGEGNDVWRVEEREVRHVVVVNDRQGEVDLVLVEEEVGLEGCEGPIGLVDDQLGVHLRDQEEFTLAYARDVGME